MKKKIEAKPSERGYHHGDLHAALLKAAEEELLEKGIEGFTLRGCARRAGVSPAAPSHHFGDVTGLLTEVAIDAFHALAATMQREIMGAVRGKIDHPIAAALGYVAYALEKPAQFNLMFRNERLHPQNPALREAGRAASGLAADAIAALRSSANAFGDPVLTREFVGLWSLSHGVASLLLAGALGPRGAEAAIAKAMVPDLVRALLGVAPENRKLDLHFIKRSSAAR